METAHSPRIAVVAARWHSGLVDRMVETFVEQMGRQGYSGIDVWGVPGAFEIPLHARRLIETQRYEAVAACGLVVDGGIYRHEFVADAVIGGLMRVQLDTGTPIFSGVLTPHHFHEHNDHRAFFLDHLAEKGTELACACAETLAGLERLATIE
ncbi:6,7-dimethyl-8-ribityllumazine synthase [Nocardia sp. NPDC052566]|uniref:6,7-dimethyl-8-ribityllumazine synthase n=1 Tax=Nocardia sp. NPDC052566 TaxID=3364330 RepID=UPI0037CAC00D